MNVRPALWPYYLAGAILFVGGILGDAILDGPFNTERWSLGDVAAFAGAVLVLVLAGVEHALRDRDRSP
jgi:hypothetical protein